MPTIKPCAAKATERAVFTLVRRAQKSIASYLNFATGDLAKYLERDAFRKMAVRLADHFFHRSRELAIHAQVMELYLSLLIMAPILQRLPLSCKFDWHRAHLLGFFRHIVSGRVGRYHYAMREVARSFQPDLLAANLERIGMHDADMAEVLLDQYRRHAGGTALKDLLAHQLFDPILMVDMKDGFELRHGNSLLRLERGPFEGSVDLRTQTAMVLDYSIQSVEHHGGRHLEIRISDACLSAFRQQVSSVIASTTTPARKLSVIDNLLRDLVERTRPARSALPQIQELRIWLATKLRGLSGANSAAKVLPNLLVNQWLQRNDSRLYLKRPTFFLDPSIIDEKTYVTFFSPYREV